MKNKHSCSRWIGALALIWASSAAAVEFRLEGPSGAVTPGSSVDIAVVASGLGLFSAPSVGGYDLLVNYDPAALGFIGATFGDSTLGNQLDLFGLGSLNSAIDFGGSINLFELSFDLPGDLEALQADGFTLVSLSFDTLISGVSALSFGPSTVSDAFGLPLSPSFAGTSVTARQPSAVPEPPVYALLAAGLLGFLQRSRSKPNGAMTPGQ